MTQQTDSPRGARQIPVAAPALIGNERTYVLEAVESTWISSTGRFIGDFERSFADYCGVEHAIAVCNGTAALHVALLGLGIGPGDEVIVPSMTYIASANAVSYCGATPVFADSEPHTGNIDPSHVASLITPATRAIMAVHLYGHPADMAALRHLAAANDVMLVEDAAEAHGARLDGVAAGALGEVAAFSFFGNKILTTGEGGMIVTDDAALAERMRILRGQGQNPDRRYWFEVIGFNYRMTNVAAAIGVAQLEQAAWHLARRREVADMYIERLERIDGLRVITEPPGSQSAFWMNSVQLDDAFPLDRDATIAELACRGIETRPWFYPIHTMPAYATYASLELPVAERLGARGINLPSSATLSRDDVDYVCDAVADVAAGHRAGTGAPVTAGPSPAASTPSS